MILDGWGMGNHGKGDVIFNTPTPYMDYLAQNYPMSQLQASGENVGLPDGQMGNSEVGHLNIGAGRIVYQDLVKINRACADGSILKNPEIVSAYEYAKQNGKSVHLMGLTSTGGVHSSLDHLFTLCGISKTYGIEHTYVHCFMDGRDTDPKSGKGFIEQLQAECEKTGCVIASIIGRFYAMDRDKRWERVEKAYDAVALGEGPQEPDAQTCLEHSYAADISDEFVIPTVIHKHPVQDGDSVVFFNFRPDRARQLTTAFVVPDFDGFPRPKKLDTYFATMTRYEDDLPVHVVYDKERIPDTLGEVLAKAGKTQLRIAETEKYAHVTYFFNGGEEEPNPGEDRILVPSPKVATYDLQPEMNAPIVTEKVIEQIKADKYDMIMLNFANADMVGHTGVFEAAVKAVETVDTCVGKIVEALKPIQGQLLIIADHGNAEQMADPDTGCPYTAHTTNHVPCILVSEEHKGDHLHDGILADVAPTMLTLAGMDIPADMTGKCLLDQ